MAEKKTADKAKKETVKAKGKATDPKAGMKNKKAADTKASKASKLAAKRGLDASPKAKDGNKSKASPKAKKQAAAASPGRIIIQANLRPGQQQQKVKVNKPKVNKPKPVQQQQPARTVIVQGAAGKKKKGKK